MRRVFESTDSIAAGAPFTRATIVAAATPSFGRRFPPSSFRAGSNHVPA